MKEPEVAKALDIIDAAEKEIWSYARSRGLPVDTVHITKLSGRRPWVRVACYRHRLFLNSRGRRVLTQASGVIGPDILATIDEAAAAYKAKRT